MKTFEVILSEVEFNTFLSISHFQIYGGLGPIFCAEFNLSVALFIKLCNNKILGDRWADDGFGELKAIEIFDHRGIL